MVGSDDITILFSAITNCISTFASKIPILSVIFHDSEILFWSSSAAFLKFGIIVNSAIFFKFVKFALSIRGTHRLHRIARLNNGTLSRAAIPGCLQTFTQNSLLYSVFLLTLFLITFSPRAVDIVKCPWSSFFYLRHFNIDYFTFTFTQHDKSSPFNWTHYVMLYPQYGHRIVTTDSVTSLHPMYTRWCMYVWMYIHYDVRRARAVE